LASICVVLVAMAVGFWVVRAASAPYLISFAILVVLIAGGLMLTRDWWSE
jgi:hypothetical protein